MKVWIKTKKPTWKGNFEHVCAELYGPELVVVPLKKFVFEITRKGSFKINVRGHFDFQIFLTPPTPSTLDIFMTVLYKTESL